jgi:putative ABC transport system permease protein
MMFILKLLFRNSFRHKLRAWLTVLSVAIAILAFGMLRSFIGAWYAGVEQSSATRLVARNAVSLIFPLPLSYKDKIRQVEGVTAVSYGNWFGGIYIDEKNFFANFAVEPKTYLELYPEYLLNEDEKAAFLRDRKAFVAGRKLAARFGWKIGDQVTLRGTIFPGNWDFVCRAIYNGKDETTDETLFMFHWDYLNESLKKTAPRRADQLGFYIIGVQNPDIVPIVARTVDEMFKNSVAETLTESEKAFQLSFISMSQAIITVIQLVSLVIIIIILAVVANTVSMTARERFGEFAVFKTLGFGAFHVAGLIVGESVIITLLGCAFGTALTFPVAGILSRILAAYFPTFRVLPETIYLNVGAAIAVGLLASVVPAWRAVHIRIADGLRRIG